MQRRAAELLAGDPEQAAAHLLAADPHDDPQTVVMLRAAAPWAILIWQLVGVAEVVDRHAEAAGGDLLDRRAARVAVRVALVAARVLPALAGIRPPPRRFIAIARVSWASATGSRGSSRRSAKRLTISLAGSTSSRGSALARLADVEQPAQRRAPLRLLVDHLGELVVGVPGRRGAPRAGHFAMVSGFHWWSRRHGATCCTPPTGRRSSLCGKARGGG